MSLPHTLYCRHKRLQVPLTLGELWLPWSSPTGELLCTPWEYVQEPCLIQGRGLLPWEWQHFQSLHFSSAAALHGSMEELAIRATGSVNEGQSYDQEGFNLTNHIVEVEAVADVQEKLHVQTQPILYVDSLVHVNTAKWSKPARAALEQMQSECLVLNPELYLSKYTLDGSHRRNEDARSAAEEVHKPARLRKGRLHRHRHTSSAQE